MLNFDIFLSNCRWGDREEEDEVVAVVESRDGSILDVIRKIRE